MAADASPLLVARDLSVAYRPDASAVSRFDCVLSAGEIVGLTGRSGSGKSSAAYALLGLVRAPGRIAGGSVVVGGRDLLALPERERARIRGREIALIVQNPRAALHPMLPVGRQIARIWREHAPAARGIDAGAEAVQLLRSVGINDPERRAQSYAHELSGGMAQRAVIAAALAAQARVLVADEPTSGLDVTVQAQFLDLMSRTVRERGTVLLLVTQEPGVLANYCDRVITMEAGRVAGEESNAEFRARQRGRTNAIVATEAQAVRDLASTGTGAVRGGGVSGDAPLDAGPRVRVADLAKVFHVGTPRRALRAVDSVSFEVAPGETLGLVGESGSGKTTVGRCLLGLETATAGTLEFEGRGTAALARADRARLQLVRQDAFDSFDPRWTLGESLREPLDLHEPGLAPDARARRIARQLQLVGCDPGIAKLRPAQVAAGTLQRVNVARAFMSAPRFVVLDEPTSLLAPEDRAGLIDVLRTLQVETGVSYLFISHDLATVASLCHRVAVMYLGQVVEVGATRALFEAPRHPYTRALVDAYLDPAAAVPRSARTHPAALAGEIPSPIDLPPGCFLASRCPWVADRCRTERQSLASVGDGHAARCWRADSLPAATPAGAAETA